MSPFFLPSDHWAYGERATLRSRNIDERCATVGDFQVTYALK